MYGCESWTIKKAERQRIDALELWCWRRLFWESPVLQGYQTSQSKGNQPWIFIGRTDAEAEVPTLWPPDVKSWLAWKDWRQEKKVSTEDEMVGWHHWLNGHDFEQSQGVGERLGKPGTLQSIGLKSIGHEWATEQQQPNLYWLLGASQCATSGPEQRLSWIFWLELTNVGGCPGVEGSQAFLLPLAALGLIRHPGTSKGSGIPSLTVEKTYECT